ncbi:MAG: Holliday junction branch migration protein RuvA [Deltaproteobacteria bacterium]|nr:MAG: Holliday junction branch migration protein RuvA [Deltaproteobacteria bacterium]
MIAALNGKVLYKYADRVVVEAGGVGYEALVTADTVARIPEDGESLFLYIHTNVREDAITLYGFLEEEEKELFLILKTVSGIGPKLAMSMLSGLPVAEICQAISRGDSKRLTVLQGVGKKTAERICLDLREKVGHLLQSGSALRREDPAVLTSQSPALADALSALQNLGYSEQVAASALAAVEQGSDQETFDNFSVEDLIRLSLRTLA